MPNSAELQAEIDAVAATLTPWGSEVINIPNAVYTGPALRLPGYIHLRGKGWGTVIPPVLSRGPGTNPAVIEKARLSDLKIMGNAVLDAQGVPLTEYLYGWRVDRGKHCRAEGVCIDRVIYGHHATADSSYNVFDGSVVTARIHCFELYSDNPDNGANSNGIHNGKLTATGGASDSPACIAIYNSNFLGITGITTMEAPTGNSHMKFIKRVNSSGVVCAGAIRAERSGLGPLCFNGIDEVSFDGTSQPWEY